MIALLRLFAQASVIDAERAFAAMAEVKGQWTAFRATAAPDAVMFVPERVNAQAWLKDRKDPPKSVRWQPTAAWVSCDGSLAVTTGAWQRDTGEGYFTTLWKRQSDGRWTWELDSGDDLTIRRPVSVAPPLRKAACTRVVASPPNMMWRDGVSGYGQSTDRTLYFQWHRSSSGVREVLVYLWQGDDWKTVIRDQTAIAAPK